MRNSLFFWLFLHFLLILSEVVLHSSRKYVLTGLKYIVSAVVARNSWIVWYSCDTYQEVEHEDARKVTPAIDSSPLLNVCNNAVNTLTKFYNIEGALVVNLICQVIQDPTNV